MRKLRYKEVSGLPEMHTDVSQAGIECQAVSLQVSATILFS